MTARGRVVERRLIGSISVVTRRLPDGTEVTSYDVERPARKKGESPVAYYGRTNCTPDDFARPHKGWYYCNPAHCTGRWRDKKARDEHLARAYAILD